MPALDPQSLPRHLDRLYRAAWALCGSPHDAEDLVQETFARVLARPRLLRGQDELAYLMTVLRNTFLTQRRSAARRPRAGFATLEEIDPVDPRARDRPEEATQAHEVFAAIAQLSESYRLALVAVDIAGLSHREAARLLDTREATIATRVFRARQQVARELSRGDRPEEPPDSRVDATAKDGDVRTDRREQGPPGSEPDGTAMPRHFPPREGEAPRRRLIQRGHP